MSYTVVVKFKRELQDDGQLVEDKPEFHGCSLRFALKQQFQAELQSAYDKSDGDLAGLFEIVSVRGDTKRIDKELSQTIKPSDPVRYALARIRWARDYNAEHGKYPDGTVGKDQQFDDWAADVAEKALKGGK